MSTLRSDWARVWRAQQLQPGRPASHRLSKSLPGSDVWRVPGAGGGGAGPSTAMASTPPSPTPAPPASVGLPAPCLWASAGAPGPLAFRPAGVRSSTPWCSRVHTIRCRRPAVAHPVGRVQADTRVGTHTHKHTHRCSHLHTTTRTRSKRARTATPTCMNWTTIIKVAQPAHTRNMPEMLSCLSCALGWGVLRQALHPPLDSRGPRDRQLDMKP